MACEAVRIGRVKRKGHAVAEIIGGKKRYYCLGYIDMMYEDLLPCCRECRRNAIYAQEDLDAWNRKEKQDDT